MVEPHGDFRFQLVRFNTVSKHVCSLLFGVSGLCWNHLEIMFHDVSFAGLTHFRKGRFGRLRSPHRMANSVAPPKTNEEGSAQEECKVTTFAPRISRPWFKLMTRFTAS